MKIIYLDLTAKLHSLYTSLLHFPPEGYQFIAREAAWFDAYDSINKTLPLRAFQHKIIEKMLPLNLAKSYLERFRKSPKGTDLTYANGHIVFKKEPWVMDLEYATHITSYNLFHFKTYKGLIERTLRSDYCKKIICWTEMCRKTLLLTLNCKEFDHKIGVVPLAVCKKSFIKDHAPKEKIKLLFVGSVNIPGEFELKGGTEILEAFVILCAKYSNLELVIRSDIPAHIKAKYEGLKNLRLYENIIPWRQLEQEFETADIFLFPSHNTPALAILDAMSYELPVITTDVWANHEMVRDGETGLVIKKSKKVPYCIKGALPNWGSSQFVYAYKIIDPEVVKELVEKISILIDNPDLRMKMGKAGREEIQTGKFSIEKRNEKLKKIFDEATQI